MRGIALFICWLSQLFVSRAAEVLTGNTADDAFVQWFRNNGIF
jgi:hypothetical protein